MLWLYLTALVILFGGAVNAVLEEFTDPDTAAGGEKKAAAKEIVENPHADHTVTAAKIAGNKNETKIAEPDNNKHNGYPTELERLEADDKPVDKKSVLKLIAGVVIGLLLREKNDSILND
jgi:hypothetical protein